GFRTVAEMIGQSDCLDKDRAITHWKANGLDFQKIFHKPTPNEGVAIYNSERQDHGLEKVLDNQLIQLSEPALTAGTPVKQDVTIKNTDRSAGAMLSGVIAKQYGHVGLPEDTIWLTLTGTAGQSFGTWAAHGVTLELIGEANDYVGKGLSGGKLIVRPHPDSKIIPEESIIVGNTVLYGAVTGECYFRGIAGERFAVRNSGAVAVVEGTGDHCCEYMTGGVAVILGATGRNFAAGMSGGIAYVYDEAGTFENQLNKELVEVEAIEIDPSIVAKQATTNGSAANHPLAPLLADMRQQDAQRLHALITRHAHYTNSAKAQQILGNWPNAITKFKKIMPIEYRRALNELAKTQATTETSASTN
nr:glutamate synthase subunit alpha [Alphaproteobacteria bacterium]